MRAVAALAELSSKKG